LHGYNPDEKFKDLVIICVKVIKAIISIVRSNGKIGLVYTNLHCCNLQKGKLNQMTTGL